MSFPEKFDKGYINKEINYIKFSIGIRVNQL